MAGLGRDFDGVRLDSDIFLIRNGHRGYGTPVINSRLGDNLDGILTHKNARFGADYVNIYSDGEDIRNVGVLKDRLDKRSKRLR